MPRSLQHSRAPARVPAGPCADTCAQVCVPARGALLAPRRRPGRAALCVHRHADGRVQRGGGGGRRGQRAAQLSGAGGSCERGVAQQGVATAGGPCVVILSAAWSWRSAALHMRDSNTRLCAQFPHVQHEHVRHHFRSARHNAPPLFFTCICTALARICCSVLLARRLHVATHHPHCNNNRHGVLLPTTCHCRCQPHPAPASPRGVCTLTPDGAHSCACGEVVGAVPYRNDCSSAYVRSGCT